MRFFIISAVLFLFSTSALAQQQTFIKIGTFTKYTPVFQLNKEHYTNSTSIGLKLSVYNLKELPLGISFHLAPGYHPSISFTYGIGFSYVFLAKKHYWLKAGLIADRIKMKQATYNLEPGEIIADEVHEAITPFVEWEWLFSDFASLYIQAGYRFIRSQTSRVTEIISRNKYAIKYKTTDPIGLYSSGFEFTVGLNIPILSK